MKLNKRQNGRADPTTLRLALCAIIGAVWLDCGQDFDVTTRVVQRLLIGPKLSPCIDPKALSSPEEVVTCPESFHEWLHDYETPSQTMPYRSLDVPRADSSDSLYDRQIPSNDGPPTTVLDAQASYTENVNQSQQRAVEPSGIHDTPDSINPEVVLTPTRLLHKYAGKVDAAPSSGSVVTSRKRQLSINKAAAQPSILDYLSDYMSLEQERCHSLRHSFSPDDFDMVMRAATPTLKKGDNMFIPLKMFYFAIGSAESLVSLKSLVEIGRRSIAGKQPSETRALTTLQRMEVVERLNSKIAYNIFERRYHIYHLFVDSRAAHQKASDGFVNSTWQSISTKSRPRMGNPQNLDDSQLSKNILEKLYPALIPGTPEYKKRSRSIGNIRKLGKRFEALVERFGYGILGLLPLQGDDLAADPVFNASDSFILSIRDDMFTSLIQCLDQLKGKVLRDTSRAVCPVVTAVFEKKWGHSDIFAIERLEQSEILQYPSGSQKLLELIS
ncbi:hypothetical protein V495_06828 [Pseudogymnoascus sp. VKM F-4514 (FW-929)]|nr:hypothetical protein V495_06828 [Pseudogymnoascus sp. VKM F-4514 (FW-929)]KFY61075.1 hypothetical protein V497_03201 [Pseudogymnoascus sp. VKM F-4516 (FW-969)]